MKMSCIEDCCWLVTVMVRKVKKILSGACLRVAITWAGTLQHQSTVIPWHGQTWVDSIFRQEIWFVKGLYRKEMKSRLVHPEVAGARKAMPSFERKWILKTAWHDEKYRWNVSRWSVKWEVWRLRWSRSRQMVDNLNIYVMAAAGGCWARWGSNWVVISGGGNGNKMVI